MTTRRRNVSVGASKEPLGKRVYRELAGRLAGHLFCCPIHPGTQLICAVCDVRWTGSAAEQVEAEALLERTALHHLTWQTWPCGRCDTQDVAMCVECYAHICESEALDGLTPDEDERLRALLGASVRLTVKPDATEGHEGDGQESHEGEELS
jgi:hypothetical protein